MVSVGKTDERGGAKSRRRAGPRATLAPVRFDLDCSENKMFYGLYSSAMHVGSVGRLTKGVAQSLAGAPDHAQDLRQSGRFSSNIIQFKKFNRFIIASGQKDLTYLAVPSKVELVIPTSGYTAVD
jgi:hypothetical protein